MPAQVTEKFAETVFNGDGIIIPETAKDDATKQVINDIIACLGSETDRSGKPGIGQAKVDQFFADAQAFSDWHKKAEADKAVLPLGDATAAAVAAVKAVKAKVDDYFTRCRLAAFDPRAGNALNREEKEYLAFAAKDLTITSARDRRFPAGARGGRQAAAADAGRQPGLGRRGGQVLSTDAVKPLLGDKTALTEAEWGQLLAKLGPLRVLVRRQGRRLGGEARAGTASAKSWPARPRRRSPSSSPRTRAWNRSSPPLPRWRSSPAITATSISCCNNFVSFRDFYGRKDKAIFQAGTLYLDQRSCDLCLTVEDAGRHALMAALAGTYLAYCDCVRKATGEKMQIVAAFTGGDSDNLMVGRNGIFYDRKGRDWDATITKIIENPISIRQAFWAPYKKVVRMIEEQVAKRAAAADAAATPEARTERNRRRPGGPDQAAAPPPPPAEPPKTKIDTGTLAAIGLVLATLLAALGGIFGAFAKLPPWQVPLAIIGILLAISLPSMILAWLKLRKRNLGPILDANGWAVNAKAKINVPFGGSLTGVAALPPGSQRDLVDPFAEKKRPWGLYITLAVIVVLAICWYLGNDYLPASTSMGLHQGLRTNEPPPAPVPK